MIGQAVFPGEQSMIDPYTGQEIGILGTDPYTGRILDMRTGEVIYDPASAATGLFYKADGTISATPDPQAPFTDPLVIEITGGTVEQARYADESAFDKLMRVGREFSDSFFSFRSRRDVAYSVGLGEEWETINRDSLTAQSMLDATADAAQSAFGWLKSLFGV